MTPRVGVLLSVLLLGASALIGVQFSSATFTDDSLVPSEVSAAADWAPPSVVVAPLDAGIFGTVTVTATVTDDRSDVGSVALEYAPAGGSSWVPLTTGCTASSGSSPLTYSCQWDTTTVTDGDYDVRAVASDTASPVAYTAVSASVPTQVANSASVVLTPVASPTRGTITLDGILLNAGNGSRSIRFEYAEAGSEAWQDAAGCAVGTTSAHTCSFATAGLNGLYDLRAVGTRGGTTFFDVQTDVLIDNTAPSATLTVPAGVLAGSVELAVQASDAHTSVDQVTIEYRRQGDATWLLCGAPTVAPYTCTLDTTTVPDGTYDFRATATDAVGNTSAFSTETRDISNAAGAVEITLPAAGATVSGQGVVVTASATSPRGVAAVAIQYRSGSSGAFTTICADTSSPYACSWDVSGLSNGAHQLRAVLTESSGGGLVNSAIVGVSVDNTTASVVFTSPSAGSTVSGAVALAATAQAASGKTVQSVTFQGPGGDAEPLCAADQAAPYTCSWSSTAVAYDAAYQIRAVLTHTDGTRAVATVVVKVDNIVGSTTSPTPTNNTRLTGQVSLATTVTSNAAAGSVRIIATPTRPSGLPTLSIPCVAGSGTPPSAVTYSCAWDTTAIASVDYSLRSEATLANGTTRLSPEPASTVRVRNLQGRDVQGVTDGDQKISNKDRLDLTYSDQVQLGSVLSGWTGNAQTVTLSFVNNGSNDSLTFSLPSLGTVQLGGDYVTANLSMTASMTASSVTVDGVLVTRLSLAVGNPGGNAPVVTSAATTTMTWTPSSLVTAVGGGSCATTPVTEPGTADRDF